MPMNNIIVAIVSMLIVVTWFYLLYTHYKCSNDTLTNLKVITDNDTVLQNKVDKMEECMRSMAYTILMLRHSDFDAYDFIIDDESIDDVIREYM